MFNKTLGNWLVAVFAMLFLALPLAGALLFDMPVQLTQPDGSILECLASGDEYHNWLHDAGKFTIMQSPETGWYVYAEKSAGKLYAGNLIPGRDDPSRAGLIPNLNISEEEYKERRNTKFSIPVERDAPTIGTINNIVIYIRFAGETEFGQNQSLYDGWFNTNASSQKTYFQEVSYNQLTVNTHFYPVSGNNFVLSWQDSNPRSYYQPYNASTNPNGYSGDTQRRTREFTLLQNATNGVSSQIPSSLVIDSDGDGRVDNVVYIVRGSAGGWNELLWPHRWALYDRFVYINGKRVYDFNFQLQDFLTSQNVGVICHEFFHTLGAPDLYHYTSNGISPVGSWDLMENNSNPPQHMGAFMKWKYGNWISSIPTISADQVYSLNPVTSSTGQVYRINSPNSSTEYFVVEYRRKMGTFENSLPGSGLLVYRINTSAGNGNA
ncbi:MAG: M6 family metalloprotease domain-containing protein, partial [Candidatus Cloacimonadaceae bacterium]|nr:M6 family metalloprotease domain-containing protein [Candidatus Cloacimonadaceae bacterium]